MSEWKEVERDVEEKEKINMWNPQAAGESIEGTYIDKEEDVGQYSSNLYTIRTDQGEINFWGSKVLDELMRKVPLRNEVRIIYKGKQQSKKGNKAWKDYQVMHREID